MARTRGYKSLGHEQALDPCIDLSQRTCELVFTYIAVHTHKYVMCCGLWGNTRVGNPAELSIMEAFNSPAAQKVRQAIVTGSFSMCGKKQCMPLVANRLPLRDEHPEWADAQATYAPITVASCYDASCNLKCPSCRTHTKMMRPGSADWSRAQRRHARVVDYLFGVPHDDVRHWIVSGSGDPFSSALTMQTFLDTNWANYPNVGVAIATNGVQLTPQMWERLHGMHANVEGVNISVDAATPSTYAKLRSRHWEQLMTNIGALHAAQVPVRLYMVVQKANFREMAAFVRLGKQLGAAAVTFSRIADWGTTTAAQHLDKAVWDPRHPLFDELWAQMSDPIFEDAIILPCQFTPYFIAARCGRKPVAQRPKIRSKRMARKNRRKLRGGKQQALSRKRRRKIRIAKRRRARRLAAPKDLPQYDIPVPTANSVEEIFSAPNHCKSIVELLAMCIAQSTTDGQLLMLDVDNFEKMQPLHRVAKPRRIWRTLTDSDTHAAFVYLHRNVQETLTKLDGRLVPGTTIAFPYTSAVDFLAWMRENDRECHALSCVGKRAAAVMLAN